MSLYQITTELQGLIDFAERCSDEEMAKAVEEHTAALTAALEDKAESYCCLIQTLNARADARKKEADRMALLSRSDANLADRLRNALRDAMINTNKKRIDTSKFKITVAANGGKIPVIIDDESLIADDFKSVQIVETIDKDAIRSALEGGAAVDGARLGVRGTRLDIR